jgi:DnaJ-class molecular chaperone
MTDRQWEAQNSRRPARSGECWQCAGNKVLYTAFGGVQRIVDCNECHGTGKTR